MNELDVIVVFLLCLAMTSCLVPYADVMSPDASINHPHNPSTDTTNTTNIYYHYPHYITLHPI